VLLPVDDTNIELLEPTEPDGPVAKFIESRGEGIHHIALHVENIEETLEHLKSKGVRLIDQNPGSGHGDPHRLVHPKETRDSSWSCARRIETRHLCCLQKWEAGV